MIDVTPFAVVMPFSSFVLSQRHSFSFCLKFLAAILLRMGGGHVGHPVCVRHKTQSSNYRERVWGREKEEVRPILFYFFFLNQENLKQSALYGVCVCVCGREVGRKAEETHMQERGGKMGATREWRNSSHTEERLGSARRKRFAIGFVTRTRKRQAVPSRPKFSFFFFLFVSIFLFVFLTLLPQ